MSHHTCLCPLCLLPFHLLPFQLLLFFLLSESNISEHSFLSFTIVIYHLYRYYFLRNSLTNMKRLQLGCCYYAAIKYVCNNWWRQSSQLERLVACLQQPCSFYQWLQAHRATTRSKLQLAAVTSKKRARTRSL